MKQSFVKPIYCSLTYFINSAACVDGTLGILESGFHDLEITDHEPITKIFASNTENSETYQNSEISCYDLHIYQLI